MKGIFGNMFDLNHDGNISLLESTMEFIFLNELLKEYYFTALKEIGLVETREDVAKYYYHGVSHYLGAETHDIGRYGDRVLEPGMVLTVEPGLYIEEWEIGIRIEDDVLVTAVKADSAVKNVLAERDELLQNLNQLKWKYFTLKAEQVPEGTENILFFGEGLNSKDLTHFADLLLQKGAKRAAVFSKADEGYVFVLLSAEKDARAYTDEMKEPFGCKGGGKPDAVQGRVAAEKKALKNFFADKEFLIAE